MELKPQTPAEETLLRQLTAPHRTELGDGTLPSEAKDDNTLRAAFLREILGQGHLTGSKGLRLRGAWIDGTLDLQGMRLQHDLSFSKCHFDEPVSLVNFSGGALNLSGCMTQDITAENARFDGPIYIRENTIVHGELNLAGAEINGDVQLCAAEIGGTAQDAIFAPSLNVEGSLYLGNYPYASNATTLVCNGSVFFSSLRAAHDVFVTNCAISPNDHSPLSNIFGATEEHGSDVALSLARAQIGGLLYFLDNQFTRGLVNLAGADVSRFKDEPMGPGSAYPLRLDGFRYQDFSRHTDTTVEARIAWLERRPSDTPFIAQPYEQLATVLTGMGHRADAQTVLMQKERLLRKEGRLTQKGLGWLAALFVDGLIRWTVGYGYRPGRSVFLALVCILALSLVFHKTWVAGDMTPNAAPVLISKDWIEATELAPDNPAVFWSAKGQGGQDWETFHPMAYAADLFIPIVDLGQESAWAPSTSRSPWGRFSWWLRWFAKGLGWIVTALGAAAVTGLIRRD